MDRIAIISDIHGNISALETVLADIEDRGIKRILFGRYSRKRTGF